MKANMTASCSVAGAERLEGEILKYMDMLHAVASRFSGDSVVVGQLITDTVAAAWQTPELQHPQALVKPWLLTKMRHLFISRRGSKKPAAAPQTHSAKPAFTLRTPYEDDAARLTSFLAADTTKGRPTNALGARRLSMGACALASEERIPALAMQR